MEVDNRKREQDAAQQCFTCLQALKKNHAIGFTIVSKTPPVPATLLRGTKREDREEFFL
jgi:hypothetical protein